MSETGPIDWRDVVGRAIVNLPPEYRTADPNDGIKKLRAELTRLQQSNAAYAEAVKKIRALCDSAGGPELGEVEEILDTLAQSAEHTTKDQI